MKKMTLLFKNIILSHYNSTTIDLQKFKCYLLLSNFPTENKRSEMK